MERIYRISGPTLAHKQAARFPAKPYYPGVDSNPAVSLNLPIETRHLVPDSLPLSIGIPLDQMAFELSKGILFDTR
jgi:hypothetical protein